MPPASSFSRPRRPARSGIAPLLRVGSRRPARSNAPASRSSSLLQPPPGSYDPAIDAQVGQANRGLGDLLSDYVRDFGEPGTALGGRSGEDYGVAKAGVQTGLGRSLADLLQGRARGAEDYGQQVAGLQRGFAQLGAAQGQAARAAGVQRGGALAQALAKRTTNEAIQRQPLDTNFARFNADSVTAEGRVREDAARDFAALDRGLLRGTEDAVTGLARARRENAQFGVDSTALRFYQADLPLGGGGSAGGASASRSASFSPFPAGRVRLPANRRPPIRTRTRRGR